MPASNVCLQPKGDNLYRWIIFPSCSGAPWTKYLKTPLSKLSTDIYKQIIEATGDFLNAVSTKDTMVSKTARFFLKYFADKLSQK